MAASRQLPPGLMAASRRRPRTDAGRQEGGLHRRAWGGGGWCRVCGQGGGGRRCGQCSGGRGAHVGIVAKDDLLCELRRWLCHRRGRCLVDAWKLPGSCAAAADCPGWSAPSSTDSAQLAARVVRALTLTQHTQHTHTYKREHMCPPLVQPPQPAQRGTMCGLVERTPRAGCRRCSRRLYQRRLGNCMQRNTGERR
jgi:hypothetical protein